jgi:hypothetical protein
LSALRATNSLTITGSTLELSHPGGALGWQASQ